VLLEVQCEALRRRFPHFNAERCAALFSEDQDDGTFEVQGQGRFPGIRMANGSTWFYLKERRPNRMNAAGEVTGVMKTRAPHGERRLLCTDRSATEMTFVEGEGHAVALASLGMPGGVVACGGVHVFQSQAAWATEELRSLATGKRVRLVFDFDAAGQAATGEVIRRLLEVGATAVAALPPQEDWAQDADVEDWLASIPTAAAAYLELTGRLGNLPWTDGADAAAQDREEEAQPEEPVRTLRLPTGQEQPTLIVMTWDSVLQRLALAVAGAPAPAGPAFESVRHDAEPQSEGLWLTGETWEFAGRRYVPDERGSMLENARRGTLVPPAPPAAEYGTSEGLWVDIRTFMQTWVALKDPRHYEALVAYVLMSYRLFDAHFPYVPYLRFFGRPGSGKGRALEVMKNLCCFSLDGQPSADNLHRVVEFFGEITLCVDEFHLDRGLNRETVERIIDTLNLGNDSKKTKLRCDQERGATVVNAYSIYGPKIFAGYGHDEHEALARRTVNIDMTGAVVPASMDLFALPKRFYDDAYELRRRLMAWRGSKYGRGLPNPDGQRPKVLLKAAGREVGQIFWPLLEMVPAGMTETEEAILSMAAGRRIETGETRAISSDAYLLETLADMGDRRGDSKKAFYCTSEIAETIDEDPAHVAASLKRLGLDHRRRRVAGSTNPRGGFVLRGTAEERAIFDHHGVTHPFDQGTVPEKEIPL